MAGIWIRNVSVAVVVDMVVGQEDEAKKERIEYEISVGMATEENKAIAANWKEQRMQKVYIKVVVSFYSASLATGLHGSVSCKHNITANKMHGSKHPWHKSRFIWLCEVVAD